MMTAIFALHPHLSHLRLSSRDLERSPPESWPTATYGYKLGPPLYSGAYNPFGFPLARLSLLDAPEPERERAALARWTAAHATHPELLADWDAALALEAERQAAAEAEQARERAEALAARRVEEARLEALREAERRQREEEARLQEEAEQARHLAEAPALVRSDWRGVDPLLTSMWQPPEEVPGWQPRATYAVDARVVHGGLDYLAVKAGVSGATGPVPVNAMDAELPDGTVVWRRLGALRLAREWAALYRVEPEDRTKPFLFVSGDVGTGKTSAILHGMMDAHLVHTRRPRGAPRRTIRVATWNCVTESLLPLYYAHRERAELRLQEAMDVDFLLFDDFGQEALPPASSEGPSIWQQRVHAVVLHRYLHRMLTAFTSNAPVASLQKHYAPPVLDRISGGSLYWVRTGKGSLRRP